MTAPWHELYEFLHKGTHLILETAEFRDCSCRGRNKQKPADQIAGLTYFLKMWRTELPWIKRRPSAGPFTHCGLCDYLKWMMQQSRDKVARENVAEILGEHFEFQAAQRAYMSQVFQESASDPSEVLAVSWDKMDQAKTIVPRIVALSNTQFMKGGSRLVVSLIGVLAPAILKRPLLYTILEDQVHGADMIASLMLDVLQESTEIMGELPRRLFIQADNTSKETKNTIALYAAAWLLVQLRGTRLQCIEFGYLVVGHTHDLIDAMFAYISKALAGQDFLSVHGMMNVLREKMTQTPIWKHLKDVYAFKEHQPHKLSSQCVKGVSQPNNVRIFWSTDGQSILVQSKHWLTSPEWSPAMVLLEREDVQSLSMLFPPVVQPCWDESFLAQSQSWGDMETSGVEQCLAILRHEDEDFLPSKLSVGDRIVKIRRAAEQKQRNAAAKGGLAFSEQLRNAMTAAFPGSSTQNRPGSTGLLRVMGARAAEADSGFCNVELETGMLVIFECTKNPHLPCRVGRILRIMRESRENMAIIEVWVDIAKPGKYERPNLFGTWSPPTRVAQVSAAKRRSRGSALQHIITIPVGKVLLWPLTLEAKEGQDAFDESGKIPFAAMHFLREAGHKDLSAKQYTFSKRGLAFYNQAVKRTANFIRAGE